jgi:hypothetical protein
MERYDDRMSTPARVILAVEIETACRSIADLREQLAYNGFGTDEWVFATEYCDHAERLLRAIRINLLDCKDDRPPKPRLTRLEP